MGFLDSAEDAGSTGVATGPDGNTAEGRTAGAPVIGTDGLWGFVDGSDVGAIPASAMSYASRAGSVSIHLVRETVIVEGSAVAPSLAREDCSRTLEATGIGLAMTGGTSAGAGLSLASVIL